ncbi:MAG: hypothetical protein WCI18_07725 [Pseudomonadota bacterium]
MNLERLKHFYSAKTMRDVYLIVFVASYLLGYVFPDVLSVAQKLISILSVFLLLVSYFVVPSSKAKKVKKVLIGFILSQLALSLYSYRKDLALFLGVAGSIFIYFGALDSVKQALSVEDHEANLTAGAFSGLVLLLVGSGIYSDGWSANFSPLVGMYFLRDFLLFTSIFITVLFLLFHPRYTSNSHDVKISFTQRLSGLFKLFKTSKLLSPIVFFSFCGSLQNGVSGYKGDKLNSQSSVDYSLVWLPAVVHLLVLLFEFKFRGQQNEVSAKILAEGGRKFLRKAGSDGKAHTFAVQTFIYTFDHDPTGDINNASPATLMQIRTEEVRKLLGGISKGKVMDESSTGSRMYGALDPEQAICLSQEALLISTISYLNISCIVNRRMQGLMSILPIIDPLLANATDREKIEEAQTKSLWLFYVDFDWVDQHLVPTGNGAHFCSNYSILPEHLKTSILNVKGGGVPIGSMLWLSEKAGNRVIQEMPHLKSIVHIFPVPLVNSNGEYLLYAIKFSELAPRLQGLYDMDFRRRLLLDFEPSEESLRLVGSLKRRMSVISGEIEVRHMVNAITSYDWRGFKEKDLAINLLMEVWANINHKQSFHAKIKKDLSDFVVQVIFEIGYPSQHLHLAQFQKNSLRSLETLREVALDVSHQRYVEAWTLLASGVASAVMTEMGSRALLDMVKVGLARSEIRSSQIFQYRVMDVICFVLAKREWIKDGDLSSLVSQTIRLLCNEQMEVDLIVAWLVRIQWVQQSLSRPLLLDEGDVAFLWKIIDSMEHSRNRNLGFLRARLSAVASKDNSDYRAG